MERGSTKHGRVLDQYMADEIAGGAAVRTGRRFDVDPPLDDEPQAGWIPDGPLPGRASSVLSGREAEQRSRIGTYLDRRVFPADRESLLAYAQGRGAPDDVLAQLDALPDGRKFATVYEIWSALGHDNERRI